MQTLLKILIFTLPLVCSNLPEFFGYSDIFRINGSYEFTKVLYFNIFSSLIIILYGIGFIFSSLFKGSTRQRDGFILSNNSFILLLSVFVINITSTFFGVFPMESLLGGSSKGHGMLMWNNLIGLSVIFLQLSKKQISQLIEIFLYSIFFVVLFGIWQFYYPSFDYGNLSNRAISTLGHPNYLAGLILISIPLLSTKRYIRNHFIRNTIKYIIIGCLFLTKSWLAIVLFFIWGIFRKIKFKRYTYIYPSLALLSGAILGFMEFPEKLHSFVSRFYIWESVLNIIRADISRIFIGFGSETLTLSFDSFKSPELYLFENFGFTADRPHNIILNFLYHFGLIGLGIIVSLYYFILKNLQHTAGISLGLIAIFLLFNYASIALYIIIVLLLVSLVKTQKFPQPPLLKGAIISLYILVFFSSISSIYYSSKFYIAERNIYITDNYEQALEILPSYQIYQYKNGEFSSFIDSEDYYLEKLYSSNNYLNNCKNLTTHFPSVENYFYCGGILEQIYPHSPSGTSPLQEEENTAIYYYKKGIEKLPDIWNQDSLYWENPIIKKSISGNRFYSKKYGDIGKVLEKLDITISQ